MKRFKNYFGILMIAMLFLVTSCTKVPAGHVGIKYFLLGGEKGQETQELGPGRYHIGWNEQLFIFPTFRQNKTWTSDVREDSPVDEDFNFQSKKGLALYASVGIEYHIPAENVPAVFERYKKGVNEITDKVLRNGCREAFNIASSTRTAEEMYGEGKVDFLDEVDSIVRVYADIRGIVIDDIFLIGNIGIPATVTAALNAKIKATQMAQQRENELRQSIAEAAKLVAEADGKGKAILIKAKAQSDANRLLNSSITRTLIDYERTKRWDGKLPQVTGGQAIPMLNLKGN